MWKYGVEQLDALALAVEPAQLAGERIRVEPVIVQRRVADLDLVLGEGGEGAHVGWAFGDDHVPWIAEHPGKQIERLLRADRNDHVLARSMDPLHAHQLDEHVAEAWIALPATVLQGARALLVEDLGGDLTDDVEGQGGGKRHPAGEAHDLGAGCDRKEGADLGRGHGPGAVGVAIQERVISAHGR